jgi:serine/threonine protein kinase
MNMAFLEEYTLLDELGQGGFATVYKVRHNELGYIRALRVMNAVIARGTEDKTYQRFIDECRLLMRIGNGNHPNIIHICRTLLKEQRAAVEMDFVDGCDLTKYVAKCGGFVPSDDVVRLLEDMSSALAYCHEDIYRFCMDRVTDDLQDDPEDGSKVLIDEQTRARLIQKYRVIHNDIHSDNIIRREDGSHVLLDFGLAIQGENVVRSSRRSDGAPEFKAPEKWDGDPELTTQSDIYSLGIVLYEYLTGRVPFPLSPEDAGSAKAIYLLGEAHKTKVPDSIYELRKAAFEKANPGKEYDNPDYPLWLEEVIMKCLEKNPQDRFLNGKELYDFVQAKKAEDKKKILKVLEEIRETPYLEPVAEPVASKEPASEPDTHKDETPVAAPVKRVPKVWMMSSIALAVIAVAAVVMGVLKVNQVKAEAESVQDGLKQNLSTVTTALEEALKPVEPLPADHPAVMYLDDNVNLSRSAMEEIPELQGLWDALNKYDYDAYVSYFRLLNNSDSYVQMLVRLRENQDRLNEYHSQEQVYLPEGEDILQTNTYLFKLRFNRGIFMI